MPHRIEVVRGRERREKLWSPKVWVRIYRCVYSSRCPMANDTGWFILELNINWRAYVVEMKLKHQTCFLYFIYYYNTSSDANELKLKHLEKPTHVCIQFTVSWTHRHTSPHLHTTSGSIDFVDVCVIWSSKASTTINISYVLVPMPVARAYYNLMLHRQSRKNFIVRKNVVLCSDLNSKSKIHISTRQWSAVLNTQEEIEHFCSRTLSRCRHVISYSTANYVKTTLRRECASRKRKPRDISNSCVSVCWCLRSTDSINIE